MISIIVVIDKNRAIGCNNQLLWDIPEDMARFKKLTTGHPVIMGRKTFESIGRALPKRSNIIVTRDKAYSAENCTVVHSIKTSLEYAKKCPGSEEIFVIGGGEIYKLALPYVNKLYLTIVEAQVSADTYFPDYQEFLKVLKEETKETDNLKYTFLELTK